MVKKKQAITKKTKSGKKANSGRSKLKPLAQPHGKVFNDQDRVSEILTQVERICKNVERAKEACRLIGTIEHNSMLLADKDREYWLQHREEILDIWKTGSEALMGAEERRSKAARASAEVRPQRPKDTDYE